MAAAGVATGLWGVGGAGAIAAPLSTPFSTVGTTEPNPSPSIFSFGPTSGPPGTSVAIRGRGFTGSTAVRFNGTDSSITATVPAGATSGPITVETPAGTTSSTSAFTVTATVPGQAVAYQISTA